MKYIGMRLLAALPALIGITVLSFALLRIIPGDPAELILAGQNPTPEEVQHLREQLGLDRPLVEQYFTYVGDLITGDLGISTRTGRPVTDEIGARAPFTIGLATASIVLGALIGVSQGLLAAVKRGTWIDHLIRLISVAGISMPVYWLSLLLIIVFAVWLHWLPSAGASEPTSIVLPAAALAIYCSGFIARHTRAATLEIIRQDYLRTAWAKGLRPRRVLGDHMLRNALLPVVTIIGLQFGQLLGGAVIIETIFSWPGLGRLAYDSIAARDYVTVQSVVLLFAVAIVVVNLATDLIYAWVDPRIRL